MLIHLFDRLWSPTLVYIAFTSTVWFTRHLTHSLLVYGIIILATIYYIVQSVFSAVKEERTLDRLGKRSGHVRTWSPFNVYFLLEALYYFSHFRNHEFWWKIFRETGNPKNPNTVESIVIGQRILFTVDEENIKAVLATQFQDFGKGPQFRKEWRDFLGLSIFTTDGEMWHNSRALLRPQFIKDRVSDLHTFEAHVKVLLPMLAGSHNGATVCADDLFYRFALDAATDFLLGKSVDSLVNGQTEFADAFTEVQRVQAVISRAGPLYTFVPRASFHRALAVLNRFVGQYIDQALQLPPEELEKMTKSDEGYTFLHAIASYTRDRQVLRDQLVAVLLAGRDTTANTLSWLFYELSRHPQIVQKLRQEIISFVGFDKEPTYSDLKSMRYLQHTLNETLRLYPVVPYNVRVALQDTTLPHGGGPDGNEPIGVTKGKTEEMRCIISTNAKGELTGLADTPVGYSTFVMQRRADVYPPTSDHFPHYLQFAPERWDHWTPKSWTYIPFNGGPRICIGQQFALTEMAYVVMRIFQTYEGVECRQEEFPGFRSDIVMQPANGVKVAFSRRG